MRGVYVFLFLVAFVVIVVGAVVLGMWLLGNSLEPYGNPNA